MNPQAQYSRLSAPEVSAFPAEAAPTESELLCKELAEQKDLNSSLIAHFENFKRRSREDVEIRAAAQKESFIQDLLPFIDNLEPTLGSGAKPGSKQFKQGVEMTLQQLHQLLSQHGIETDELIGQPFDPHQHEAVSQRRDPAKPTTRSLRCSSAVIGGGEKVFRAAKVVVNRNDRKYEQT